jgi:hypothetical protein
LLRLRNSAAVGQQSPSRFAEILRETREVLHRPTGRLRRNVLGFRFEHLQNAIGVGWVPAEGSATSAAVTVAPLMSSSKASLCKRDIVCKTCSATTSRSRNAIVIPSCSIRRTHKTHSKFEPRNNARHV